MFRSSALFFTILMHAISTLLLSPISLSILHSKPAIAASATPKTTKSNSTASTPKLPVIDPKKAPPTPAKCISKGVYLDLDGDGYYSKVEIKPVCDGIPPANYRLDSGKGLDCDDIKSDDKPTETPADKRYKLHPYNAIDNNGDGKYQKKPANLPVSICEADPLPAKYLLKVWGKEVAQSAADDAKPYKKTAPSSLPSGLVIDHNKRPSPTPTLCPTRAIYLDLDGDGYYSKIEYKPICDEIPPANYMLTPGKGLDCDDITGDDKPTESPANTRYKNYPYTGIDSNGDGKYRKVTVSKGTPIICEGDPLPPKYKLVNFLIEKEQSAADDAKPYIKPSPSPSPTSSPTPTPTVCTTKAVYLDLDGDGYYSKIETKSVCNGVAPANYMLTAGNGLDCDDIKSDDKPGEPPADQRYKNHPYNGIDANGDGKYRKVVASSGVPMICEAIPLPAKYKLVNFLIEQEQSASDDAKPFVKSTPSATPSPSVTPNPSKPPTPESTPKPSVIPSQWIISSPSPSPSPIPSAAIPPRIIADREFPGHDPAGKALPAVISERKSSEPSPSPTSSEALSQLGWKTFVATPESQKLWIEGHNSAWKNRAELIAHQDKVDSLDWIMGFFHEFYQSKAAEWVEPRFESMPDGEQIKLWFDYTRFRSYSYAESPEYFANGTSQTLSSNEVSGEDSWLGLVSYAQYRIYKIELRNPTDYGMCLTYSNHADLIKGGAVTDENPAFLPPHKNLIVEFYDKSDELSKPGSSISIGLGNCSRHKNQVSSLRLLSLKIKAGEPAMNGSCPADSTLGTGKCGTQSCNCNPGYHFESLAQQKASRYGLPDPFAGKMNGSSDASCESDAFTLLENRTLNGSKYKDLRQGLEVTDLRCVEDLCKLSDQTIYTDETMTKCALCTAGSKPDQTRSRCEPDPTPPSRPQTTSCLEEIGTWPNNAYVPTDRMLVPDGAGGCAPAKCSHSFIRTEAPIIWGIREELKPLFRGSDYYDELRQENRVFIFNKEKICACPKETHYLDADLSGITGPITPQMIEDRTECKAIPSCNFSDSYAGTFYWSPKSRRCEKTCQEANTEFLPNPKRCECVAGYGKRFPGKFQDCEKKDDFACEDKTKFPDYETQGWPCTLDRCPVHAEWVGGDDGGCKCRLGWHTKDGQSCIPIDDSSASLHTYKMKVASLVQKQMDVLLPPAHADEEPGTPEPSPEPSTISDYLCTYVDWNWMCGEEPPITDPSPTPTPSDDVSESPTPEPTEWPSYPPDPTPSSSPSDEPTDLPSASPSPTTSSPTHRVDVARNKTKTPSTSGTVSQPEPEDSSIKRGAGPAKTEFTSGIIPPRPSAIPTTAAPNSGNVDLGASISIGQNHSSANSDGPALSEDDSEFVAKMSREMLAKQAKMQEALASSQSQIAQLQKNVLGRLQQLQKSLENKYKYKVSSGSGIIDWLSGLTIYNTLESAYHTGEIPEIRKALLEDLGKILEIIQKDPNFTPEQRQALRQPFNEMFKAVTKVGMDASDSWEKSQEDLTTLVALTEFSISIVTLVLAPEITAGAGALGLSTQIGLRAYHYNKISEYALLFAQGGIDAYDPTPRPGSKYGERLQQEANKAFLDQAFSIEASSVVAGLLGGVIPLIKPGVDSKATILNKIREFSSQLVEKLFLTLQFGMYGHSVFQVTSEIADYLINSENLTEKERLEKAKTIAKEAVTATVNLADILGTIHLLEISNPDAPNLHTRGEELLSESALDFAGVGKANTPVIQPNDLGSIPQAFRISKTNSIKLEEVTPTVPSTSLLTIKDSDGVVQEIWSEIAKVDASKFLERIRNKVSFLNKENSSLGEGLLNALQTLQDIAKSGKINLTLYVTTNGQGEAVMGSAFSRIKTDGKIEIGFDINRFLTDGTADFDVIAIHELDHAYRLYLAQDAVNELAAVNKDFPNAARELGEIAKTLDILDWRNDRMKDWIKNHGTLPQQEYYDAWLKQSQMVNIATSKKEKERLAIAAERNWRILNGQSANLSMTELLYPYMEEVRNLLRTAPPFLDEKGSNLSLNGQRIFELLHELSNKYRMIKLISTDGFSKDLHLDQDFMSKDLAEYIAISGAQGRFSDSEVDLLNKIWNRARNLSKALLGDASASDDWPWDKVFHEIRHTGNASHTEPGFQLAPRLEANIAKEGFPLAAQRGRGLPEESQIAKQVPMPPSKIARHGETNMMIYQESDSAFSRNKNLLRENKGLQDLEKGKAYTFVVKSDGNRTYGEVTNGWEFGVKHINLADGNNVIAAGELRIRSDGSIEFNLLSGTYTLPIIKNEIATQDELKKGVEKIFNAESGGNTVTYKGNEKLTPDHPPTDAEMVDLENSRSFNNPNGNGRFCDGVVPTEP